MILACHNLEKSFGDQVIVRHGSFHIEDHEKAALIGLNGAGKSTILKMITGELPSDSGEIILAKGKQIGDVYKRQPHTQSNLSVSLAILVAPGPYPSAFTTRIMFVSGEI